jgi:signal transduction histidine kinase
MFLKYLKQLSRKITFRLTLWYALFFVFSSLFLIGIGYIALWNSMRTKDHQIVSEKINTYTNIIEHSGVPGLVQELERTRYQNEQYGFFIHVVGKNGVILNQTLPQTWNATQMQLIQTSLPFVEDQWTLLKKPRLTGTLGRLTGGDDLEVTGRLLRDGSLLHVGYSTHAREQYLGYYLGVFLSILGPVILFGIMIGVFLARRALKPVRDLTLATQSVRAGRMDARVPLGETNTELRELARQFNAMLDWIATLTNSMREALDNVAHDLRTPLTRMRFSIESVMQREPDKAALQEALLDCAEESGHILNMLNALMDISEAETGCMKLELKEIDLKELMSTIADIYLYDAEEKNIRLEMNIPDNLMAYGDSIRLRQAIANLVDNAIKYTPSGGCVTIDAGRNETNIFISVSDTGEGISQADMSRIFERLYRGDKSRSQRGLGLGLCMVKAIATAHHGAIHVQNLPGRGAVFTLTLPQHPPIVSATTPLADSNTVG